MHARRLNLLARRFAILCCLCLLSSITLTGCPPPWPKCSSDKDCAADKSDNPNKRQFYCINGACQQCRTAQDCGSKQKCDGYTCADKTCADVSCPGGKRCDPNTLACKWICENDGDTPCDGDRCKVCKSHQCVPRPPKCTRDTDCPGAQQICKSPGTCDAACEKGCSAAKPCPAGFKCDNGNCVEDQCNPENIYFNFNRSFIRSDAKEALRRNLDCINKMKDKKLLIEGHCDERGTRGYNIQLGKRRARSTKRFLKKLGIGNARMCTVSKGREEPAVPNASTEEQHQKNRRSVFKFVDSCP